MSKYLRLVLFLVALSPFAFLATSGAVAQPLPNNCATNRTLVVCVDSAALTVITPNTNDVLVKVSVTLRVTNQTEFPVDIAFMGRGWNFTPSNAAAVEPSNDPSFSGALACYNLNNCNFSTLAPGQPFRLQLSYPAYITRAALPLSQVASRASLSGTLIMVERGKSTLVPLPIPDFTFGNGLTGLR